MADEEEQQNESEQEVTDDQAADDAINDAEPKTYSEEQFSGLLRDKQAETAGRQQAQAEVIAAKAETERLQTELEDARKPKDEYDEDAQEPITRAELKAFGKELVDSIGKTVTQQRDTDKATSLKNAQAQDAQALVKTHTVKTHGVGLDAQTVIDEGTPYLRIHHPELVVAAERNPHYASKLYDYCVAFVPSIKKRVQTRINALRAAELDQSGDTPPLSGGPRPVGNEEAILMSIMDGSMPEAEVEKLVEA